MYVLSICEWTKQILFISIKVVTHCQPQPLPVWQKFRGHICILDFTQWYFVCESKHISAPWHHVISPSSCELYLPTRVISYKSYSRREKRNSVFPWCLHVCCMSLGRCAVEPSNSKSTSIHGMISHDLWNHLSRLLPHYPVQPRHINLLLWLQNVLYINARGLNKNDLPQLVGPCSRMLAFFCRPVVRSFWTHCKTHWF